MSPRTWLPVLLALGAVSAGAARKPVTLDAVTRPGSLRMAAPVSWAPDGTRFAYREGSSLWLYDAATQNKREVVNVSKLEEKAAKPLSADSGFDWQNRRVTEPSFAWSASGEQMLVTAGGDLFLVKVADSSFEQLTATPDAERDPKLSPDAKRASFRRGHDLYCVEVATKKVTRLTRDGSDTLLNGELDWVYPEELDLGTAHWWSPDSTRIAYLQFDVAREPVFPQVDLLGARGRLEPERYPKAGDPNAEVRLGVVAAAGGPTEWMDLGETRDHLLARVAWTPDSQRVAVERLNRVQNRLDLLFAGAATGVSAPVLTETDPYWINVADHLRFLEDGKRFLWSSERSGFRHLYLVSLDGKEQKQVTSGEWEVNDVTAVDEAARKIYFTATADSPLERHLYVTSFDGGGIRKLTAGKGTHTISMGPTARFYLDSHSSLASPSRRTLHAGDGRQIAVYQEADRSVPDAYEILPTEIHQVAASDGATLYARLIKPSGFDPSKKYPAVVFVYGGPHAQTVRDSWAGATWEQMLAHRGFVIWQLDNRGSSGRGHRWESAVFRNLGAKELEDQKEGVAYLVKQGFVDAARIGMYGWSYGGYMTLFTLTHAPDLLRAGIAGAPVTSWHNYDSIYTERYMGLPTENTANYQRSSPATNAANLKARLMLVHNFGDDNVHFQNTLQMSDALQKAGKHFELMVYPQKTHGVTGPVRRQMLEAMTDFFERTLKGPIP